MTQDNKKITFKCIKLFLIYGICTIFLVVGYKYAISGINVIYPEVLYNPSQIQFPVRAVRTPMYNLVQGEYVWQVTYQAEYEQSYELLSLDSEGNLQLHAQGKLAEGENTFEIRHVIDEAQSENRFFVYLDYDGQGILILKSSRLLLDGVVIQSAESEDMASIYFGVHNGRVERIPFLYASYYFNNNMNGKHAYTIHTSDYDEENSYMVVYRYNDDDYYDMIYNSDEQEFSSNMDIEVKSQREIENSGNAISAYVEVYKNELDGHEVHVWADDGKHLYAYKKPIIYAICISGILMLILLSMIIFGMDKYITLGIKYSGLGFALLAYILYAVDCYKFLPVVNMLIYNMALCILYALFVTEDWRIKKLWERNIK